MRRTISNTIEQDQHEPLARIARLKTADATKANEPHAKALDTLNKESSELRRGVNEALSQPFACVSKASRVRPLLLDHTSRQARASESPSADDVDHLSCSA